jgi:UDP-glucose:glycoprotein glucosyltransferase
MEQDPGLGITGVRVSWPIVLTLEMPLFPRPVLPSGCEHLANPCARLGTHGPLNLAGYGAELALKNMEYKAADDSEVKKDGSAGSESAPAAEDLTEEVNGFIFSKLLERRPDKEAELLTFRDVLLSAGAADDSDKISVWELKEIGFQAVQRIVQAREPLRLMQARVAGRKFLVALTCLSCRACCVRVSTS